ncbi:nuclear protein MDM1-like isoform X2 [Mizuhopecten yessoensis]|uniref:Nuclear protein MDM1 n=1 Tax=Mizuhopecten yessoensis TaxID=6573 RepID=A0A210QRT2_MIZYE|nr:nuclear protein MDM1-like isoform X2 [Mizuhopecten yessoensis]OWF51431.1 Nuclear protein MDM1 [Mizuhopecten yessoensis]
MPVHFKTSSEYKEHYKPTQSYKSATFSPSAEQMAPAAGRQSSKLGVPSEPPMQRKKRLDGPMTSISTNFHQEPESPASAEYALLGANDKFVENVKYKARSRGASPPKQQKLAQRKNEKENRLETSKPKPAPMVNTEMYRKPTKKESKPTAPPKPEESPKVTTPMAPRGMKSMPPLQLKSELEAPKMSTKSPVKSRAKTINSNDVNRQESVSKLPLKDKMISNMNESVQTNMDKGVALSAPEAPAEYALKYKAGVAPPRPKRKVSEYQKSFDWKVGGKASPLLAAEQIVYNSNPAVAPFRKDVIPKKSEYDVQFQNWKLNECEDKPVQAAGKSSKKRSKVKRSKSVGALSPDKMEAAGSGPIITSDNKRLTKETPDVEVRRRPPIPQGQLRRTRSEYCNNYKAPSSFDYVKGAWRGANPPHLQAPEPEDQSANATGPSLSNWFAEVIELRRKAQEYRKRAQGTHFSREHAVQLLAQQTEAWDVQSSARSGHSTLSALSLETGSARNGASRRDSARATMASDEQMREQDLETEVVVNKMARQDNNEDEDSIITPSSSTVEETDGGRIPTPKWQQKSSKRVGARHHLDLTTPAVGGAILTSPPQRSRPQGRKAVFKSQPIALQDFEDDDDDTHVEEVVRQPIAGQTFAKQIDVNQGRIGPTPTFGMPSRDTHYLRDDQVSCDQPLQTSYVHSPLKNQVNKHIPPPGVNIPSTINEGFGCTYNQPHSLYKQAEDVDDDVLSVSARSVASSCSLASETLERARKRKEEFWGKPRVAAN